MWSVVEKEINEHSHNTKDALKAAIIQVMSDMYKKQLIRAGNWFRPRKGAIIYANGGFID